MIVQEHFEIDGVDFIRTYSDAGRYVVGGVPHSNYEVACDPAEFGRTFTETDIPVDPDETEAEGILNILVGVEE